MVQFITVSLWGIKDKEKEYTYLSHKIFIMEIGSKIVFMDLAPMFFGQGNAIMGN